MKLRLQVVSGSGAPFPFEHAGPVCHVGRDPACELPLPGDASQGVSWRHARIDLGPEGAWVTDLQSSNGTFVQGRRVEGRAPLRSGDEILLGQIGPRLRVTALELAALGRPAAAAAPKAAPRRPAAPANRPLLLAGAALALAVLLAAVVAWQESRLADLARHNDDLTTRTAELAQKVTELSRERDQDLTRKTAAELSQLSPLLKDMSQNLKVVGAAMGKFTLPPERSSPPPEKPAPPGAKPPAPPAIGRVALGKVLAPAQGLRGFLVSRAASGGDWQKLAPGARVHSADTLLSLPGYRSEVELDGGLRLVLWGDFADINSEVPALESRVVLHEPAGGMAVDLTLERGRVVLTNSTKGEARARLRLGPYVWDVFLPDDQARAAAELRTGYVFGDPVRKDRAQPPPLRVLMLYTHGRAVVRSWKAVPPFPNADRLLYRLLAADQTETVWPQLAAWWSGKSDVGFPVADDVLEKLGGDLAQGKLTEALAQTWQLPAKLEPVKILATFCLGSVGAMPPLVDGVAGQRDTQVRLSAVWSLRAWDGARPQRDGELVRFLKDGKKYGEGQADTFVGLLHGPARNARQQPGVSARLFKLLQDPHPGLRELASWQLTLLAPEVAAAVRYDPLADEAPRQEAARRWRQLLAGDKTAPAPEKGT